MKILAIVFNQVGRGTYWRAFHLGRVLAARGHAVTLLAMSPGARLRWRERCEAGLRLVESPDLLWGPLRSGWDPWDALRRLLWLRHEKFDVVHAFECRPVVIFPALYARRRGARLVLDWADWFGRGGSVEERPNPLVRAALRPVETIFEERFRTRADGTTVINEFLRARAVALGVPPNSILLLRNGSDERIRPPALPEARRRLGLPPDVPLVGYVGNIFARDARLMAAAFNWLQAELPEARLLLVGRLNRDIEALLDDPAAALRTGDVDYERVFEWLAACDVCWLPLSDSGANRGRWPLKLNDYWTAGRPIVGTDVGELGAALSASGAGLVAEASPAALAAHTRALLGDPGRREAMGQAGRAVAGSTAWSRIAHDLERFYCRILTG